MNQCALEARLPFLERSGLKWVGHVFTAVRAVAAIFNPQGPFPGTKLKQVNGSASKDARRRRFPSSGRYYRLRLPDRGGGPLI